MMARISWMGNRKSQYIYFLSALPLNIAKAKQKKKERRNRFKDSQSINSSIVSAKGFTQAFHALNKWKVEQMLEKQMLQTPAKR